MAFQELKQKGNNCIKQKNYTQAVEFYTNALDADPSSHAVYSNRSLAYSNLGDFVRALQDATKCLDLAPMFARGYLRKAVALSGLTKYEEAMVAAQDGYKLRGSDAISHDCVAQWIKANQAIHGPLVEQKLHGQLDLLPQGSLVLSEEYLNIFLDALIYRVRSTNEIDRVFNVRLLSLIVSCSFSVTIHALTSKHGWRTFTRPPRQTHLQQEFHQTQSLPFWQKLTNLPLG